MNSFQMAWRNLWRNKRRTLITVASIFFAVIMSTLMSSLQDGTYNKMIDNMVHLYTGYLQVHQKDYWENKSINNTYELNEELKQGVMDNEHVTQAVPRLESFALIAYKDHTKGAALIGIQPEKEDNMTKLSQWVKKGKYLQPGDDGILVAKNIASYLKAEVGDTLVLLSQGYHGVSAAGLYPVKGILEFTSPDMNNLGVYMDLQHAQSFFGAPDRITSMALMVDGYDVVDETHSALNAKLDTNLQVMAWDEMNPEIVQFIESDKGSGVIMKAILYLVIGFGILGTVIMMIAERKRELGVMVAVGMQKSRLMAMLFFETIMIGVLGVIAGFIVSLPIIAYLVGNPVPLPPDQAQMYEQYGFEPALFFGNDPQVFLGQVAVVFVLTALISLYPVIKINNLKVNNALRA